MSKIESEQNLYEQFHDKDVPVHITWNGRGRHIPTEVLHIRCGACETYLHGYKCPECGANAVYPTCKICGERISNFRSHHHLATHGFEALNLEGHEYKYIATPKYRWYLDAYFLFPIGIFVTSCVAFALLSMPWYSYLIAFGLCAVIILPFFLMMKTIEITGDGRW